MTTLEVLALWLYWRGTALKAVRPTEYPIVARTKGTEGFPVTNIITDHTQEEYVIVN